MLGDHICPGLLMGSYCQVAVWRQMGNILRVCIHFRVHWKVKSSKTTAANWCHSGQPGRTECALTSAVLGAELRWIYSRRCESFHCCSPAVLDWAEIISVSRAVKRAQRRLSAVGYTRLIIQGTALLEGERVRRLEKMPSCLFASPRSGTSTGASSWRVWCRRTRATTRA